jgi:hypothetical protein
VLRFPTSLDACLPETVVQGCRDHYHEFLSTGKQKKKKKLKIKPGTVTGNRVVFDEDGEALEPLAQLPLPDSTGCAHVLPCWHCRAPCIGSTCYWHEHSFSSRTCLGSMCKHMK